MQGVVSSEVNIVKESERGAFHQHSHRTSRPALTICHDTLLLGSSHVTPPSDLRRVSVVQ